MSESTYAEVVAKAEHYLAIGSESVYLSNLDGVDWSTCVECDPGGLWRLGLTVSLALTFEYAVGIDRLRMRAIFDVETRGSNGQGYYQIDTPAITRLLANLPAKPAQQLRDYLAASADVVDEAARKAQEATSAQFGMAATMRQLARLQPETADVATP